MRGVAMGLAMLCLACSGGEGTSKPEPKPAPEVEAESAPEPSKRAASSDLVGSYEVVSNTSETGGCDGDGKPSPRPPEKLFRVVAGEGIGGAYLGVEACASPSECEQVLGWTVFEPDDPSGQANEGFGTLGESPDCTLTHSNTTLSPTADGVRFEETYFDVPAKPGECTVEAAERRRGEMKCQSRDVLVGRRVN